LPFSLLYLWEGKLTVEAILWYMPTLTVMGVFFSLVYFWSRNIVLGIIIHGLWDWFLSIWIVKGAYSNGILEDPSAAFGSMDLVNTLITAAIMLPFFYLLYRLFWKQSARETDPKPWRIVTATQDLFFVLRWMTAPVRWLFEHIRWTRRADRGEVFKYPWVFCFVFTTIFCLLMLPIGSAFETEDPAQQKDRRFEPIYETFSEPFNASASGELYEGSYTEITIRAQDGWLDYVNATLTWTDEAPDNSRYTNDPDTFTVSFIDPGGAEMGTQTGSGGNLALSWSTDVATNTSVIIRILLVEAGDQYPPFNPGGLRTVEDTQNSYSVTYSYQISHTELVEEEDYNIRW